ncbi:protein-glutamate O-methyltransferase CheR [Rhodobacteraceae bacterium DSL-40]|uniref:CheR family methyltransferase n=1 Tax=Amaricoccus sp. B4 TaxID=3368557 RepID=UPI000DAF2F87
MTLAEPARSPGAGGVAGQEIRLTPEVFRRIARAVREYAGISLPESKMALVQARLAKRLRALGMTDFAPYCALIEGRSDEALAERQELITAITTNVTRFFREPHHFDMLRTRVLPPLIEHARKGGRVRLWSAGCSTGEEPYSIALTMLDMASDAGRHDIKILATDLDRAVLATANRGIYPERALEAVPATLRKAHFQPRTEGNETGFAVGPAARALISFRQLNLTLPFPMRGSFDVIFCRNVVIYFDAETELSVWKAFSERLPPGGWLFVGHSERINTLALPMFASDGVTSYRRL